MVDAFNGQMLVLARQMRRESQSSLVKALKGRVTQGQLSKIEQGLAAPNETLKRAFADALRVKPTFFENADYVRSMPISYHRKRQKLSAKDEASIHGHSEAFRLNIRKLLEAIELEHRLPPIPHLDVISHGGNVEKIAASVRQHWGLPRGPIKSVTQVVEDAGAIVVPFNFETQLMDGFAQRATDNFPPVVFINNTQPIDRYRFSLSHELGHLTMHLTPSPTQEIEANMFASAFLMPKDDISAHPNRLNMQKLQELKMYWGVSMQAIIYRAWELGKISDRSKKYFYIEMNKRGWRENEPIDVTAKEKATALRDVVSAYVNELGYTISDIGELTGFTEEEVVKLYPVKVEKPKLRLVVGGSS